MAIAIIGTVGFAFLSWLSLGIGTALGAAYTGEQELVRTTIGLGAASAGYAIASFELFIYRGKIRRVRPETRSNIGCLLAGPWMIVVGLLLLMMAL